MKISLNTPCYHTLPFSKTEAGVVETPAYMLKEKITYEMSARRARKKVGVIGAGPAGLATLKELQDRGLDAMAFEAQPTIGGLFARQYRDLQLTSSNLITSFGSYSDGEERHPAIWTRDEYLTYLNAYAQRFDLFPRLHLSTRVESLRRDAGTGKFLLRVVPSSAECGARRGPAAEDQGRRLPAPDGRELELDAVAICTGVNTLPSAPTWPGQARFRGRILHAAEFWSAEEFADQRVLIVGLGESGSDIALLVAAVAKASAISSRKGPGFVIPRYAGGKPSDLDTNRCYHAIPRSLQASPLVRFKTRIEDVFLAPGDDRGVLRKAAEINRRRGYSPFHRFGLKNTSFIEAVLRYGTEYKADIDHLEEERAVFVDGTSFQCDAIIVCTGYRFSFPFLAQTHPDLAREASQPRALFKRMILPRLGFDLSWIGFVRPALGSIPTCAEMQARYLALLLSGERELPSRDEMERDIGMEASLDLEQFPEDAERIAPLTDYLRFMEGMAELIGCRPPLLQLFFRAPRTWAKVMFGPLAAAQFRLTGPGAEPERARAVLARLPTMPWPVLTYEFMVLLGAKLLSWLRKDGHPGRQPIGF
jgi:dimethylaniline monooxygenase (N-oxide forming)